MIEDRSGYVLLRRREGGEGVLHVLVNNALRAAQLLQRLETHDPGSTLALSCPQALHDELQKRRLHSRRAIPALGRTPSRGSQLHLPGRHLVENSLDEGGLGLDPLVDGDELVVPCDRTQYRFTTGRTIEIVEPEIVAENVRDLALEAVELGNGVFPK